MRLFGSVTVVVVVSAVSCAPPKEVYPPPTPTEVGTAVGAPTSALIGSAGGSVKTPDGRFTVRIPAGALSADTQIVIQPATNTSPGAAGLAYELLPDGQVFAVPVELTLAYTEADVAGSGPEFLTLAFQNAERVWEILPTTLDEAASTITASTTHFTYYSAGHDLELQPSGATVKTGYVQNFTVVLCGEEPTGRDARGVSRFRFTCFKPSASLAGRVLGKWSVNGVLGGDATLGTVSGSDIVEFKAPNSVPNPSTVTLSAHATDAEGFDWGDLKASVKIVPSGLAYGGRYTFSQRYGSDLVLSGTADLSWTRTTAGGDVDTYDATGQINAHFVAADCDPADAVLPIKDSEMVIYTASNVAFPRQYFFTVVSEATVSLNCGRPRMPTPRAIGTTFSGGVCMPPPFASFTDEKLLAGDETCMDATRSWSFTGE